MNTHTTLSVIAPLYNEEDSVELLHSTITKNIKLLNINYEVIFVDDGSSDSTFEIGKQIASKDRNLKIIKLRRNYGQTPAMVAGINFARGDIIVTMDGDLQNDPSDIPNLLSKIEEGFDIAVGWREKRKDKLLTRKIPSKIANWIIGKITGVPIKDNGCSLKAYRSEIIKCVPLYSEMHRFIPAMASISGARIVEIPVKHHARIYGQSKYGLSRTYKVIVDLLTIKMLSSFASRPLYWFFILAIPFLIFGLAVLIAIIYFYLIPHAVSSFVPIIGVTILFFAVSGFLYFCGILAELVYQTGFVRLDELTKHTLRIIRS